MKIVLTRPLTSSRTYSESRSGASPCGRKAKDLKKVFGLLFLLTITACTKEAAKNHDAVNERKAPPMILDSFNVETESRQISIKKSSLGKSFLLVPTARSSGRAPQWNDFRPLVVSFEKSAQRLGLFKLTNDNLYKAIAADHLLQTFAIVKETDDEIKFSWGSGLKSFDLGSGFDIVDPGSFGKMVQKKQNGEETALQVKDSFVRSVKQVENSIQIEQVSRLVSENLTVADDEDSEEGGSKIERAEGTISFVLEILPYTENPNFKTPKLMDPSQKVGFFVNLAFKEDQVLPNPQIMRWDLAPERPPVIVAISENTPAEVVPAFQEGALYWNRVLGREAFKIQTGFKLDGIPQNRMIIIRWIPWSSAGYAYASAQADPLTGEIIRGQVFMTSSWYLHGKTSFQWPTDNNFGKIQQEKQNSLLDSWTQSQILCRTEQKDFHFNEDFFQVTPEVRQRASLDMVRQVIAHEMGHVLGLRHNFMGSSTFPGTDQELLTAKTKYFEKLTQGGLSRDISYPLSTTTMDYHEALETSMLGTYIQDQVLPYDVDAIGWAYNGKALPETKYQYCSDEHIGAANEVHRDIFDCERFDAYKNPLLGLLVHGRKALLNLSLRSFAGRVQSMQAENPYKIVKDLDAASMKLSVSAEDLKKFLFSNTTNNHIFALPTIIDGFISSLEFLPAKVQLTHYLYEDTKYSDRLQTATKELGGLSEMIKWYLPFPEAKANFAKNQVQKFFEQVGSQPIEKVSPADLAKIREVYLQAAEKFDNEHELSLLKEFLPFQSENEMTLSSANSKEKKEFKKSILYYNSKIEFGNLVELLSRFRAAANPREKEISVVAYGQTLQLKTPTKGLTNAEMFKAFIPENWGPIHQYKLASVLKEQKELLRQDLATNILLVLKAASVSMAPEADSASLRAALDKVDWSQIKGVSKFDAPIQEELSSLAGLETTKKEQ